MSRDSHGELVVLNEKAAAAKAHATGGRRRALLYGAIAALLLIVALALGLGLGLGLGLKHHRDSTAPASTNSSGQSLPSLQPTPQNNFVLDGLAGQPPQTRSYDFVISQVLGAPDGVSKPMLVVNGMYPGPTIEVNQGDRIVVNVTNLLENRTTIHWHGLFQNQTNYYDGTAGITECGIPPGQSLVYNFTLGDFSGTTWWHAHYSTQYTDGITGALIVHPASPPPVKFPSWDHELVVQVADLYHTFSSILLASYLSPWGIDGTAGDEPVPDAGVLNGLGQWGGGGDYFNFTLEANKTYRIRLVNTGSFASIRFSVDYHTLSVVEADGTLVQPYDVAGVTLAVAQRYSVLLRTDNSTGGPFWMRAAVQSDMFTYDEPGQNLDIRGVIRYGPTANDTALPVETDDPGVPSQPSLQDMDTAQLVPAVVAPAPPSTRQYPLTIALELADSQLFLGFMNGTSWTPLQGTTTLLQARAAFQGGGVYGTEGGSLQSGGQFMVTEDSVQVVDLLISNLDDGDHPFHLHGHRPWIMGTGPGRYIGQPLNATNPLRRDTFLIPAYNWMVIRFITDNPGLWAFHCHLAWHMAAGLLMQINSLPSKAAQLDIPQSIVSQCAATVDGAGAR